MFTTFIGLIDIQSWWEVPCIAHFCSLFSSTFKLPEFYIEELEEALLTDTDAEGEVVNAKVCTALKLSELIVALLKGCDTLAPISSQISPSNYQMFLRRLFREKCQVYNVENPFNTDTDFEKLPLRTKILILKYLCDFRLDSEDVCNSISGYLPDSIRLEPIGYDRNGSSYWYFYGTRLYREDRVPGKSKASKAATIWQVICFTEEDWRNPATNRQNYNKKKEPAPQKTTAENSSPKQQKQHHQQETKQHPKHSQQQKQQHKKQHHQKQQQQHQQQKQQQQKDPQSKKHDKTDTQTPTDRTNNRPTKKQENQMNKQTTQTEKTTTRTGKKNKSKRRRKEAHGEGNQPCDTQHISDRTTMETENTKEKKFQRANPTATTSLPREITTKHRDKQTNEPTQHHKNSNNTKKAHEQQKKNSR
uniref:Putative thyroid hormone receptor-associated protein complex subunit n=1 Tax=Anopheles marajoara TaxID=58244 RepID=A0A2M4BPA1_9DIPT